MKLSGAPAAGYSTGEAMAEVERIVAQLPDGFGFEWTGQSYEEKQAGSPITDLVQLCHLGGFPVLGRAV